MELRYLNKKLSKILQQDWILIAGIERGCDFRDKLFDLEKIGRISSGFWLDLEGKRWEFWRKKIATLRLESRASEAQQQSES